jgi:predicted nucleotidyltransferase
VKFNLPEDQIADFCRKWGVTEFALFGSVLRDDFRSDSDVDVLLTFSPDSGVSLFDFVDMQDELEAAFGRPVDVVSRRGVELSENPYRRHSILNSARVVYAAS